MRKTHAKVFKPHKRFCGKFVSSIDRLKLGPGSKLAFLILGRDVMLQLPEALSQDQARTDEFLIAG